MNAEPTRLRLDISPFGARAMLEDEAGPLAFGFADSNGGDTVTGRPFLGRLVGRSPELGAVFLDIGLDQPALLPEREVTRLDAPAPTEGSAVIVEGRRPPRQGKGARVSADLALPGFGLILHPRRSELQVSARLGRSERKALLARGRALFGADAGLTLRAQALGIGDDALRAEAEGLTRRWHALQAEARTARPGPLGPPPTAVTDLVRRHLQRDTRAIEADPAVLAAIRPVLAGAGRSDVALVAVDATDDIDEALARAIEPVLPLPSGGRLIIEPTAALVAIDVDAGEAVGRGKDALNAEAIGEALRAVRQRNLGGTIVIDLVDPGSERAWALIDAALRARLHEDTVPCRHALVRPMGLVVLSRARSGPGLAERLTKGGRPVPLWQAIRLWHALRRALPPARHVRVAPELAAFLAGCGREQWMRGLAELGARPQITAVPGLGRDFELTSMSEP